MNRPGLFILGGSTYYTLLLLKALVDLGLHHQLGRITLFARNESRLRTITNCGAQLLGDALPIDYTLNAEDMLSPEYSLLFNQMRFGGLGSRDQDEKIALEVGLFADETLGIVGASNAVRSIVGMKPFLELLKCKQGHYQFINFTNPCSIVTEYAARNLSVPVIGVCDYPQMMRHSIATYYGVKPADVDMSYFGINHFGYIHDVYVKGENKLAELRRANLLFKPDSNRYFNTILNVSWRYLFEQDEVVLQQRQKLNRAAQLLDIEKELDACVVNHGEDLHRIMELLGRRHCNWFELVVGPLFQGLLIGSEHYEYLNVACRNPLSPDQNTVIETGIQINAGSLKLDNISLPSIFGAEFFLVQQMKQAEIQMLKSILSMDFNGIIQSCLTNPLITNKNKTIRYFDRLNQTDEAFVRIFN